MDKLNLFFSKIKELSFWQRLFSWKSIVSLSNEAEQEFKLFENNIKTENSNLKNQLSGLEKEKLILETKVNSFDAKVNELNNQIKFHNEKISKFEATEEERTRNYEKNIAHQNQIKDSLEKERQRLGDERVKEKEDAYQKMKSTWTVHETEVEQTIKKICLTQSIEYIDKVPFAGKPDNAIRICDEYIIFDAKSPSGDDLKNFPNYINEQTKGVKKYANQENVKKDIFLVIPSNTYQVIQKYSYIMSDYNVYVITKDSLEPIILSLKKIEEYELAEQLSPEDRDNLCRVIGKFTHSTKRRIMIDQYFIDYNLEVLQKCKKVIPDDLLKQVILIENAEVINPPSDKRNKQILTKDLEEKQKRLNTEIVASGIEILEKDVEEGK